MNGFRVTCEKNVTSTEMLQLSLLGVGTVLRPERDSETAKASNKRARAPPHRSHGGCRVDVPSTLTRHQS